MDLDDVRGKSVKTTQSNRSRRAEAGLSLVEVLIASTLLLMVMLGLVPIFLQSVMNNAEGNESSRVSNAARSAAEEYFSYGFENANMVVTSGTKNEYPQWYNKAASKWVDGTPTSGANVLTRKVTVQQHQLRDLEDDGQLNTPFASPPAAGGAVNLYPVHLRWVIIEVDGRTVAGGPLSRVLNKAVTLRVLRGF